MYETRIIKSSLFLVWKIATGIGNNLHKLRDFIVDNKIKNIVQIRYLNQTARCRVCRLFDESNFHYFLFAMFCFPINTIEFISFLSCCY